MSKTKLLHQNFLLIFQKSPTSNIFLDPKEGVNPPPLSPPMRMYALNSRSADLGTYLVRNCITSQVPTYFTCSYSGTMTSPIKLTLLTEKISKLYHSIKSCGKNHSLKTGHSRSKFLPVLMGKIPNFSVPTEAFRFLYKSNLNLMTSSYTYY